MDCTRSAEERGPPVLAGTNGDESLLSHPVPFGHVPYSPALPGAMGPLWDFPAEWWYRGGSGIKEVVRLTIVAHCGRRCAEGALRVGRGVKASICPREARKFF